MNILISFLIALLIKHLFWRFFVINPDNYREHQRAREIIDGSDLRKWVANREAENNNYIKRIPVIKDGKILTKYMVTPWETSEVNTKWELVIFIIVLTASLFITS